MRIITESNLFVGFNNPKLITVLYYKYVQEHLSKIIQVYFPVPHV